MADKNSILQSAQAYISRLNPRERTFILVGAVVLLFFVIFLGLSLSHRGGRSKKTSLDQLSDQRMQFEQAVQEYAQIKPVVDIVDQRVAQRPADFDLYNKVNELIETTTIRPFVLKMDPGSVEGKEFLDEDYVDLNLQKIDIRMLVNFLTQVEQLPGLVRIGQLTIKTRMDNTKTLDVVMRISSYKEKIK